MRRPRPTPVTLLRRALVVLILAISALFFTAARPAWATQLRMLAGSLLKSIAAEVGHNVVKKLNVHGPAAPSWQRGPRRVQGRGPRDTYG